MGNCSPLVSVIVPIYNVRPYLDQCMDSLLNQTLQDIEIILIDDGSTDGSSERCDDYAGDSRVRVYHKENAGLAAARNDGIRLARAEYLLFVDADDWVTPEYCEIPYRIALEKQADLVCFRHYNAKKSDTEITPETPFAREGIVTENEAKLWLSIETVAWNKLYKVSLFNHISYPEGRLFEDTATAHKLQHAANRIWLMNEYLYYHRPDRPGSIMNTMTPKEWEENNRAFLQRYKDLIIWGFDVREQVLGLLIANGTGSHVGQECMKILEKDLNSTAGFSRKHALIFSVYRFSPRLFDLICRAAGKRRKFQQSSL